LSAVTVPPREPPGVGGEGGGDVMAYEDQRVGGAGCPRRRAPLVEDQFVALRGVAPAGGADGLDEPADGVHVVAEGQVPGDVGGALVAVVAVGDDADADARDLLEQPGDGALDVPAHLGQARVHAAGGVEAEDDLNGGGHATSSFGVLNDYRTTARACNVGSGGVGPRAW